MFIDDKLQFALDYLKIKHSSIMSNSVQAYRGNINAKRNWRTNVTHSSTNIKSTHLCGFLLTKHQCVCLFGGREGRLEGLLCRRGHRGIRVTLTKKPGTHQVLQMRSQILSHSEHQRVHGWLSRISYSMVHVLQVIHCDKNYTSTKD
jgi:hypothetical protein